MQEYLDSVLADVGLWWLTQLDQKEYIKVIGDYLKALAVLDYLEENGYRVDLKPLGNYNQIIIKRENT